MIRVSILSFFCHYKCCSQLTIIMSKLSIFINPCILVHITVNSNDEKNLINIILTLRFKCIRFYHFRLMKVNLTMIEFTRS